MGPKLRPRPQLPPGDHSYCQRPDVPQYDLSSGPRIMSGPSLPRPPKVKSSEKLPQHEGKKRRWYFGERKRKYIKRRKVGSTNNKPLGENRSAFAASVADSQKLSVDTNCSLTNSSTTARTTRGRASVFSSESFTVSSHDLAEAGPSCVDQCDMLDQKCSSDKTKPSKTFISSSSRDSIADSDMILNSVKSVHKRPTCRCLKNWRSGCKREADDIPSRQSQRLVRKNYKLPFQVFPMTVQIHIFSMLSPWERGHAALVCRDWAQLLRSPRLWAKVDLTMFNPPVRRLKHSIQARLFLMQWFSNFGEYKTYINRIAKFVNFLISIRPCLGRLQFAFDLQDVPGANLLEAPGETWMNYLLELLDNSQCHELEEVKFDWTKTPVRPPCAEKYCCLFNKARLKFQQHYARIQQFHIFLNKLTKRAGNIQVLSVPFDWSPRSVLCLSRLHLLRHLTLEQYMGQFPLTPELLSALLAALPCLVYFKTVICMNTLKGRTRFTLNHNQLAHLDITGSQGFYLREVNLPRLETFMLNRFPWDGPQINMENTLSCLYHILRNGAPNLTHFTRHKVQPVWLEYAYPEFEAILKLVCPCKLHVYYDSVAVV